jgi:hypothetical protein
MTFKEYLAQRRVTNTIAGDFTKEARADSNLPDAKSWEELRTYVARTAPREKRGVWVEAAHRVWGGYRKALAPTDRAEKALSTT